MQNLDDLVSQAESIATNLENDEVPHIHRNIEQLRRRGETFYNRAGQNDVKAAKLLGNKVGYELSVGLSKTLESLNVLSSYDSLSMINIEDIPSFLKNERETAILSSINLTRNNTLNMSYKLCEQAKSDWWKREKSNILNLLVNSDKLSSLLPLGSNKAASVGIITGENSGFTKSVLSKEEMQYARELSKYVDEQLCQSGETSRLSLFEQLTQSELSPLFSGNSTELSEIARLVERYSACRRTHSQHSNLAEMRSGGGGTESDSMLSRAMVEAAVYHLELEYCTYAHQSVAVMTGTAITGDACHPSRREMALFVADHLLPVLESHGNGNGALEDGTVSGVPVWPLMFVCLRAGMHRDAVSVAKDASSNIGDFHALLQSWIDNGGVLPTDQARKVSTEYKRHVRASGDGCKRLLYALLAANDTIDSDDAHGAVLATVDDFMWLRLTQVRRSRSVPASGVSVGMDQSLSSPLHHHHHRAGLTMDQSTLSSSSSLAALQKSIAEEYGEAHFQASQQPLTFCRLLLLCQLFEPAMAFLARFEQLRCHAVHLALALWQNDLLLLVGTHRPLDAPLLSTASDGDMQPLPRLNLARLVTLYTRKFEAAHPRNALDLFYLLKDLPLADDDDNEETQVNDEDYVMDGFVACVSSLAVESGQLELLFGEQPQQQHGHDDSYRQRPGLLSRYGGSVAAAVLRAVSRRLRRTGRVEAACDALQLAGRFPEAALDLSELLVGTVTLPANHPTVARLQTKAEFVLARLPPSSQEAALLACVLSVAQFILASGDRDAEAALAALDRTQLLPNSSDAGSIRSATEAFRNLPELVRSLFPGLLVSAMRTLRTVAKLRQCSQESLVDIRRRAAALITFTGQLPYRMPAEVYASLSQLELEIN